MTSGSHPPKPPTIRGDQIPLELPDYVWEGLVPLSAITHLVGPSGVGKSTLAAMLAARWTTGQLTGRPERVLMVMTEDSPSSTTIPRVIAHGGDPALIEMPERQWNLPEDLGEIERTLGLTGARIVIFDPLQGILANIAGQGARKTLGLIHDMAERLGVAVVFLHHFIKSATRSKTVADAIGGGYGIYGIARSILVLGYEPVDLIERMLKADSEEPDPDAEPEEAGERFVVAHEKHSFGPLHPSVLYVRQPAPHPAAPLDPEKSVGVFREVRQVHFTPLQVMHAVRAGDLRETGRPREQAKALILMLLAQAEDGGLRGTELQGKVVGAGFSLHTMQRARADLFREGMIEPFQMRNQRGQAVVWRWRLVIPDTVEGE